MSTEHPAGESGTCFVVMGFGKKPDFETGRTLDLDLTYEYIIKPSVEDAGLRCVRADEVVHSGLIDVPMYEQLLNADVVIADLSTSNKNAYYELGVRHALRPYTTIIICEDGVKTFPFDINRNLIRQYHHMETGIDFKEVLRFRKVLTEAIKELMGKEPRASDSPVYTFLNNLTPPALAKAMQGVAEAAAMSAPDAATGPEPTSGGVDAETHRVLMQQVERAVKANDFTTAKALLSTVRGMMKAADPGRPEDPYIIQQLALATYKSKQPTLVRALEEARELLKTLNPETSNDTETLGIWGAVHKRLWDELKGEAEKTGGDAKAAEPHLNEAVRGYERGFYLRNDYYNGINLAFLLNVRADHAAELARADDPAKAAGHWASAIADFVQAERVRQEVLAICEQWLAENPPPDEKASDEAKAAHVETRYWVVATKAEALLGTGRAEQAEQTYNEAYALNPPKAFMVTSTKEQREKLQKMLTNSPLRHVRPEAA
jgi:tetratricopeptide (TPR) repeat protein